MGILGILDQKFSVTHLDMFIIEKWTVHISENN